MIFQGSPILSDRELKGLKEHKYSSSCSSLLDPMLQRLWNWVVTLVPLWVAPNLITMVGLVVNIVTTLVLVYHCPTATEVPPWWSSTACALGLFFYQTLDAIDGKQARRTKSSSPLGELFDHGCDSLSTVFVSLAGCCATRIGLYPAWLMFQCLTASVLFYVAHWQTYVTGTLMFGYIDVTEGQFIMMGIMLLSSVESVLGVDIWNSNVFYMFSLSQCLTLFGTAMGMISLVKEEGTIDRILTGGAGKNGATVAGTSVLSPATPLLLVIMGAWVIAYKSTEFVFHNQPLLYVTLFCFIAAKITNRLVVAHMCKGEITIGDAAMFAPLALFLNQYFNTLFSESTLLYLCMVWVVVDLTWYCYSVCVEICQALGVELFTIPYPPPVDQGTSVNGSGGASSSTRSRKKHSKN